MVRGIHKVNLKPFNCLLNNNPNKYESGSSTPFGSTCLVEIIQWKQRINLNMNKTYVDIYCLSYCLFQYKLDW